MTTAPPPAHYGAVEGTLASGFATAELHHLAGHDRAFMQIPRSKCRESGFVQSLTIPISDERL
ncbi:hypothetical protein FHT82_003421 [Rhizobium sp. BK275]|uniref:hypothetical protein n=1 Tax=unclassified Rhizobium TaxID=2613769 RepID=UPI001607569B|nr:MULTISPECIES: hypothetical protein [unclassified Rhizobium]MBB3390649.1 hypothetical protein [Rhizobium sp. BK275]MBB3406570.1 hypothetical protein [Rhizobium sp. BK316]